MVEKLWESGGKRGGKTRRERAAVKPSFYPPFPRVLRRYTPPLCTAKNCSMRALKTLITMRPNAAPRKAYPLFHAPYYCSNTYYEEKRSLTVV